MPINVLVVVLWPSRGSPGKHEHGKRGKPGLSVRLFSVPTFSRSPCMLPNFHVNYWNNLQQWKRFFKNTHKGRRKAPGAKRRLQGETANFILLLIYLIFTFSPPKNLKGTQLTCVFSQPLVAKSYKTPQISAQPNRIGRLLMLRPMWAPSKHPAFQLGLHFQCALGFIPTSRTSGWSEKRWFIQEISQIRSNTFISGNFKQTYNHYCCVISWEAVARKCAGPCQANVAFHH